MIKMAMNARVISYLLLRVWCYLCCMLCVRQQTPIAAAYVVQTGFFGLGNAPLKLYNELKGLREVRVQTYPGCTRPLVINLSP